MNAYITSLDVFQKYLCPCALGESSLSIERVKILPLFLLLLYPFPVVPPSHLSVPFLLVLHFPPSSNIPFPPPSIPPHLCLFPPSESIPFSFLYTSTKSPSYFTPFSIPPSPLFWASLFSGKRCCVLLPNQGQAGAAYRPQLKPNYQSSKGFTFVRLEVGLIKFPRQDRV